MCIHVAVKVSISERFSGNLQEGGKMTDNQMVEPTAYFNFVYTQKRAIKLFFKEKKGNPSPY